MFYICISYENNRKDKTEESDKQMRER